MSGPPSQVPDWLLSIPRLVWAPVRWIARRFRRYAVDRQSLVREGSTVVTPVSQLVQALGPESIVWGTDEQNKDLLAQRYEKWEELRGPLMTYGNHHPSDRVKEQAAEVEQAVMLDLNRTVLLLATRRTATTMDAFEESKRAHADALEKTDRLIEEIRSY